MQAELSWESRDDSEWPWKQLSEADCLEILVFKGLVLHDASCIDEQIAVIKVSFAYLHMVNYISCSEQLKLWAHIYSSSKSVVSAIAVQFTLDFIYSFIHKNLIRISIWCRQNVVQMCNVSRCVCTVYQLKLTTVQQAYIASEILGQTLSLETMRTFSNIINPIRFHH